MNAFCGIGCFLLLMGGCSLGGSAALQSRLDAVPRMTCDQLIGKGPPSDGQVALTDLQPCGNGFVATRSDGDLDLYIPAYPAHLAAEPEPKDLVLLLQVWSDDDRRLLLDQPKPSEVTCWATRRARIVTFSRGPGEVEDWVQDRLRAKYPGIRLANMLVLTFGHGDTPTAQRVRSAHEYGIWEIAIGGIVLAVGAVLELSRFVRTTPSKFEAPARQIRAT
jgi:hypothetical protein